MVITRRHGSARVNVPGAKQRYPSHRPDGTPRPSYKNDSGDVPPTRKNSKKSSSSSSDNDIDDDDNEDEDKSESEESGARIDEDSSKNEADDASTANEMETTMNNPLSTSSSIQFNSDIVYYDVFMAFPRHLPIPSSEIDVLESIITKIHVADAQRNQNKQSIRERQQVDSWNTKHGSVRKDIPYFHDDNIGDDSLSSQSTYLHDFYC
jgi:hypothetical protein